MYRKLMACLLALSLQPAMANSIERFLAQQPNDLSTETGVYLLEQGQQALVGRAWLTENVKKSIDVQYFIWSTDNVGTLAAQSLLKAAERGVNVRVIVDDLLVDASGDLLLALASHKNVAIRIYNPKHSVGVNIVEKLKDLVVNFRSSNQRMHDKTALFDGVVGITGGRNMADEYFDLDHEYNFRDRDILLIGAAVAQMQTSFERFWNSPLAIPVEELLQWDSFWLSTRQQAQLINQLHRYADSPNNFSPVFRKKIEQLPLDFPALSEQLIWTDVHFISDMPGKNEGKNGLEGGGVTTSALVQLVEQAQHSIVIQSPYLILPNGGIALLKRKIAQGVKIKIVTNSLASTDNLAAFSGYHKVREQLLEIGVELYEFKPRPLVHTQLMAPQEREERGLPPQFALHAKTMVIDQQTLFVGSFNFDPRSAHLNTEVGALLQSAELATQVEKTIMRDMEAHSSWRITPEQDPDEQVGLLKRLKLVGYKLLPLDPIL